MRPHSFRILVSLVCMATLAAIAWSMVGIPPFEVEDVGPDDSIFDPGSRNATSGGRVNNLAIDPTNDDIIYAASEWGGLFKSFDGADSWIQLDNHIPQATWDIAVDPLNTGNVYATSFYDGRMPSISGINYSRDGGATWTTPPTGAPPAPLPGCNNNHIMERQAYGIGIRPDQPTDVFVGTPCGLAISTNRGTTWNHVTPTSQVPAPTNNRGNQVWDVFVQAGGIVDICGNDGHHRSTDNGASWSGVSTLPGGQCSIVASPLEPNTLFVTGPAGGLYESRNGGNTWTQIDDTGGGRIPFVEAVQTGANTFDLYWGEGVKLRRVPCDDSSTPRCGSANTTDGTGNLGADVTGGTAHDDTGDVAFDSNGCALYHSNDGGVFKNTGCPGVSWTRSMSGMHSMWAWDLDGSSDITGDTGPGIVFGLQDDGIWLTSDGTSTWDSLACCDVFDTAMDPDRTAYTFCCAGGNGPTTVLRFGDSDGTGFGQSPSAPPSGLIQIFREVPALAQFGPEKYALVTYNCLINDPMNSIFNRACPGPDPDNDGTALGGVWITQDEGSSWTTLGGAGNPPGVCGVQASVSLGTPVFTALTNDCDAIPNANVGNGQLFQYSGTGQGGAWFQVPGPFVDVGVYHVHPTNPNRIIASDEGSMPPRVMLTEDGGNSWTELTALAAAVNQGGLFPLINVTGPTEFSSIGGYAQFSLVGFHPEDDNVLIAGARDAGLFLSSDNGASWSQVSDRVSRPYHAFFDVPNDAIYVGTVGRGVYKVLQPEADLGITKGDNPDPVNAGDQLFYTITVENNGPADATNVTVIDELPPEVDFIVDDLDICVEDSPGTLICDMGDIPDGQSRTVVIKVKVQQDVVADAGQPISIQNTASVSAPGIIDPDDSDNSIVIGTIVEDLANLAVTKLCEPDRTIPAGETAICTIIIDNYGPSDARDVIALDALASEGDFEIVGDPVPSQGGPCFVWNNTWSCNIGTLEAATSSIEGRATIEVQVTADEGVDIADLTKVVSDTPDPDVNNNESTDVILVEASADLNLAKYDSPDPVVAGEEISYNIPFLNSGPSTAENVVVTDVLPAGVTIVSVEGSDGADCNAGVPGDPFQPTTCNFGTVPPNSGSRSVDIVVMVDPDTRGDLINDARISSDTVDPDTSNDLASATTTVEAEADLTIAKTDQQDPVIAGEILDYELTIVNNGPSSAKNVIVTDVLPAELTFISATILDGEGECVLADPATNTVECHIGEILPNAGTPVFIAIKTVVDASTPAGDIVNDASVNSTETPETIPGDNDTSETTSVITEADLAIDKTSNQDTYKPSSQVIYTIMVTNLGSSDAQDVVVTDVLPAENHDYLHDTAECTGGPSGTATCELGTIPAGASSSFNLHIKMKGSSGLITNTVSVASSTSDPDMANNTDVLENLISGSTSEGGGSGPGNNGLSPEEDDGFALVSAEAFCSSRNLMDLQFEWLDEKPGLRKGHIMLEMSPYRDFRAQGLHRAAVSGQKAGLQKRLAPSTVYHWRLSVGGGQGKGIGKAQYHSGTATFITPTCPGYDIEDEWE